MRSVSPGGRIKWLAFAGLLVGAAYFAYKLKYPDYVYRYRLELTLEVGGKAHTGSSVIEVRWIGGPSISNQGTYAADGYVEGQAPLIDLGELGILTASLIDGDSASPGDAVPALWLCAKAFGNDTSAKQLPNLVRETGRRDLKPENWPRLMWLPDRRDPMSARKISLNEIGDVFGRGARFTAGSVEMTSDPIVIDIDKKLPWYRAWADEYRRKQPVYDPRKMILRPNMLLGNA